MRLRQRFRHVEGDHGAARGSLIEMHERSAVAVLGATEDFLCPVHYAARVPRDAVHSKPKDEAQREPKRGDLQVGRRPGLEALVELLAEHLARGFHQRDFQISAPKVGPVRR